jgi:hypothetical protein
MIPQECKTDEEKRTKRNQMEKQGLLTLRIVTMTRIDQLELTTGRNVELSR